MSWGPAETSIKIENIFWDNLFWLSSFDDVDIRTSVPRENIV